MFKVTGIASVQAELKRRAANIRNAGNALDKALELEIGAIRRRVAESTDRDGKPLAKYSDSYREYRKKRGYTETVNLTVTGKMLSGMRATVTRGLKSIEGKIFFASEQAKKAYYNQITRPFFGLSEEQVARVRRKVEEFING